MAVHIVPEVKWFGKILPHSSSWS